MAKKKKNTLSWFTLIPLLVCILVTPIALHMASVLALSGPDALALLYPWVQVVKSPLLRISADITMPVAQGIMYLQFPVYGLLMTWIMRSRQFMLALVTVAFVHGAGILAVYLFGYLHSPTLRF
jgi:hypothetical protein